LRRLVEPKVEVLDTPGLTESAPSFEGDVDIVDLLEKSKEVLRREIHNLLLESMKGRLKVGDAGVLADYIRLLNSMVKEEKKIIENLDELTKVKS